MTEEGARPRVRKMTLVLGSSAVGVVSFVCALRWDFGPLALLASTGFVAAMLFGIPIRHCDGCGRDGVGSSPSCPYCTAPYLEPPGTFLSLFTDPKRLILEIPLALVLLLFSMRLLCAAVLV